MNQENSSKKENKIRAFFASLYRRWDRKMEEAAKARPCCCSKQESRDDQACCS